MSSITAEVSSEGYARISNGKIRKTITLKDYVRVLNSLLGEESASFERSTIRYPSSVHSVSTTARGYTVNLYYPETEKELNHTRAGKGMSYVPNIMIKVDLIRNDGKTDEYSLGAIRWYCTDKSRVSLGTEWPTGGSSTGHIWTLPFPNVYGDARMCTGGNRLPSVIYNDWTVLDMLYNDVLCGSQFNNDLGLNSVSDYNEGTDWFRYLFDYYKRDDTTRFPYEMLHNY